MVGSDESEALIRRGLVVDDRLQMQEFMSYATKAADCGEFCLSSLLSVWSKLVADFRFVRWGCWAFDPLVSEMAAEVVNLLIPRNESSTLMQRHCIEKDRLQLQRYILVRASSSGRWVLGGRVLICPPSVHTPLSTGLLSLLTRCVQRSVSNRCDVLILFFVSCCSSAS